MQSCFYSITLVCCICKYVFVFFSGRLLKTVISHLIDVVVIAVNVVFGAAGCQIKSFIRSFIHSFVHSSICLSQICHAARQRSLLPHHQAVMSLYKTRQAM